MDKVRRMRSELYQLNGMAYRARDLSLFTRLYSWKGAQAQSTRAGTHTGMLLRKHLEKRGVVVFHSWL